MSDEEEYEEEEIEEEEEVDEEEVEEEPAKEEPAPVAEVKAPSPAPVSQADEPEVPKEEAPKLRKVERKEEEPEEQKELTEAEQAMLAARKRKEEDDAMKLLDFEQQRKLEKERIEQEIRELREKQNQRKKEREAEEREWAEKMKQAEERRRQDEEDRKKKTEADKQKREEEKMKRQQMIAGSLLGAINAAGGPNFVIQKGAGGGAGGGEDGGEEGGKRRRGPTKEQLEAAKRNYINMVSRKPDLDNILPNDLKVQIKRLGAKIERLVGEIYDLQQRAGRQEYDMKELHDRQMQATRNKALQMGIDPTEAGDLKHPPKLHVASKFDRQTDHRPYGTRREMFEKPFVPPQPKIAHGTARPPPEWGRKKGTGVMDEIETIRKNLEPPKYVEQAVVEGAKPPVQPKPLQLPSDDEPAAKAAKPVEAEA